MMAKVRRRRTSLASRDVARGAPGGASGVSGVRVAAVASDMRARPLGRAASWKPQNIRGRVAAEPLPSTRFAPEQQVGDHRPVLRRPPTA